MRRDQGEVTRPGTRLGGPGHSRPEQPGPAAESSHPPSSRSRCRTGSSAASAASSAFVKPSGYTCHQMACSAPDATGPPWRALAITRAGRGGSSVLDRLTLKKSASGYR